MSGPVREVLVGGRPIRVADDQPTFWDRVEAGGWEPGTLAVLERLLGSGALFVDVGAWVGALSLYAASLGAEVVALEPDPRAFAQLRRNLAANPALAGRVRLVPRALAPTPGPVRMGARRKPGDSMSSVLLADAGETWTAPGITSTELASDLGGRRLDLLKLDIEGGEYGLLPALGPMLDRTSALLLALHPDILGVSGDGNAEDATSVALDVLRGWHVGRVEAGGVLPARSEDVARAGPAEWLFTPVAPASTLSTRRQAG